MIRVKFGKGYRIAAVGDTKARRTIRKSANGASVRKERKSPTLVPANGCVPSIKSRARSMCCAMRSKESRE